MGEVRAGREPIDGRKGKIMTPNCGKLRKKCFQATEIILALTLACSGLHAQASQVQTFPLSGAQDLDARNVKVESTEYKGRKAICITLPVSPAPASGPRFTFLRGVDFADGIIEADVAAKVTLITPAGFSPSPPASSESRSAPGPTPITMSSFTFVQATPAQPIRRSGTTRFNMSQCRILTGPSCGGAGPRSTRPMRTWSPRPGPE